MYLDKIFFLETGTRPASFLGMDAWMGSQQSVALILELCGSLICLAYVFDMLSKNLKTSKLNVNLIRKLCGSLICLAYVFDMLSMGVCKTRHW